MTVRFSRVRRAKDAGTWLFAFAPSKGPPLELKKRAALNGVYEIHTGFYVGIGICRVQGFPKLGVIFLGVPIKRVIVCLWGCLILETTNTGTTVFGVF